MWYQNLLKQNRIPDSLIRTGIRFYNRQHLRRLNQPGKETLRKNLLQRLESFPVAAVPEKANEQHYEVPAAFFEKVLGPHLKYSCGFWPTGQETLAEAEAKMLALSCERAQLSNGQAILELGCGWGSLSLYMAEQYPQSQITAVSNSHSQRQFIEARAQARGLENLNIITADINDFAPEQKFDRIVSVEMFEHLRNYPEIFKRMNTWLYPNAKVFIHIFGHREHLYLFEVEHPRDWMAKYFFSGGTMPSQDLLLNCCDPLEPIQFWVVNGQHYQKTSEAWLARMDQHKQDLLPLFAETYGKENTTRWWAYWRIFFMACAELFGHSQGQEWQVYHYLFEKRAQDA
ncbi:SAM-dependent methyltransferase [bacterium (Candidatus Blackallbacteria) CG17_big_fil_post_rev_8_21_14_2_50_48_46]|uniref:SAM-dependent methyltransferase n=1 Tax=bacterium (Candidatus Blackallbacteria) CG17_big_fil_post_rev_8_21_14_2_50_48_46 TaxID=2014261 RepID=A0A2M7FY39_9BACT|nr:MAG: SAM-dependent methyltransferase [bacterium (Candidatus Blackallbacteria) CG18_big_fil_WC_8_21_14_2_50_49_26]PIW14118.1 MAG: SAM-dependent methyltransferase [bacterium (Candidatus Blackallbacteria) CG17_big_fil_post_rev_8_21_14_2_50_48_46]PIW45848.1 MAG: SAM-dependent methyltransferase [bacterium (Candidatus Blackallbacteria) CG13_big_fil_rev_8_21_14_2_50_49_14]